MPWLSRRPSNTHTFSLGLAPIPAATPHPRPPPWDMFPRWFLHSKHGMAPAGEETCEVWSWLRWTSLFPNLCPLSNCTWKLGMLPNESTDGGSTVLPSRTQSPAPVERKAIPSSAQAVKWAPLLQRAAAIPPSQKKKTSPGRNGFITRCLAGWAGSPQIPGFAICAASGLWEGAGLTLPFHLTQPSHSRDYPRLSKGKLRSRRPPILPEHWAWQPAFQPRSHYQLPYNEGAKLHTRPTWSSRRSWGAEGCGRGERGRWVEWCKGEKQLMQMRES